MPRNLYGPDHEAFRASVREFVERTLKPRAERQPMKQVTEGLRRMTGRIASLMPKSPAKRREDDALAVVATLVGALVLARAVNDSDLSDNILEAARAHLTDGK